MVFISNVISNVIHTAHKTSFYWFLLQLQKKGKIQNILRVFHYNLQS